MIWDYSLYIMAAAVVANAGNKAGFEIALIWSLISIGLQPFIDSTNGIEVFALYAAGCLLTLYCIATMEKTRIRDDIMALQVIGMAVQFLGLLMWVLYYGPEVWLTLTESVFIIEAARLIIHGVSERVAKHRRGRTSNNLRNHRWSAKVQ